MNVAIFRFPLVADIAEKTNLTEYNVSASRYLLSLYKASDLVPNDADDPEPITEF
jgi:hypothetical protein